MCGIIGLLIKNRDEQRNLGALMTPMFDCMAERGPDSAGLAIFGDAAAGDLRIYSLFSDTDFQWLDEEAFEQHPVGPLSLRVQGNHALLTASNQPQEWKAWIAKNFPPVHLLSIGKRIQLYKDQGHPMEIAKEYDFPHMAGTHCVGHTRMATESAVSPAHAHPFTAGEDFCLVHNGSLSNPYMLRRKLEAEGLHFETDNDTEAACRFIEWRMRQGATLDEALETALVELDGFFTLLIATADQLTLVRDAFACKPAVVAETDAYVAISSEFRSLAHLPGVENATIFEPLPEVIYSWKV